VPEAAWELGRKATTLPWGGGSRCPQGVKQVVRVTWAGGVRKAGGTDADESVRDLYRVAVQGADGTVKNVTPVALADLNDGDNNHLLCLDTAATVRSVSFPADRLIDPRDDLNPATSISLAHNAWK
jgi:hypothetical protein